MTKPKQNKKRESIFCNVQGFETKESDSGDLIKGGYIATTHLDSGFFDDSKDAFVRDKIAKETLYLWADEINQGVPRANKVSVNHQREPHVTGVGVKGSARVDSLGDGEFGLYVDSLIDKTKDTFEDVNYRLDKGLLDSYSIEFTTKDIVTGEYLPNAVTEETVSNGVVRTLLPGTQLEGWTLASQPMNEHAVMIKEVIKNHTHNLIDEKENTKEVINMTEKKEDEKVEEKPAEEKVEEKVEETTTEETSKEEEKEISEDDLKLLREYKTLKTKESKEKETKEMVKKVKEELKEELKIVKVEEKVAINKETENKELMNFKESIKSDSKMNVSQQFQLAGAMIEKCGLVDGTEFKVSKSRVDFKNFAVNGTNLEFKGLGITTNQNTDTDYLLSAAELADVFDPVIYNSLNQTTTTWNLLPKEDFSSKGNNQVQFTLKTAANTTAGAYVGNAVSTGNVTRLKYQTKFKKYQVGVEVDGDMIAAARGGPIGDVFAREVQDSTDDLMSVINTALFAEVGLETASGVIGFEYITDSAGNTTLYNLTRSVTNRLKPDTATDTYINGNSQRITLNNLRLGVEQAEVEGANLNNLVWVTHPTQVRLFKGIYDASQRLMPTSSRFGFEGRPDFDGVPIFSDKDCNSDDWFLIDLETHKIAMWVPPTLEMLGKDSDSQKGFIKTYFATYNRDPRRMVQIHTNATS